MTETAYCTEGFFDSEYYDFYSAGEWTQPETEENEPENEEPSTFNLNIVMIAGG